MWPAKRNTDCSLMSHGLLLWFSERNSFFLGCMISVCIGMSPKNVQNGSYPEVNRKSLDAILGLF